MKVKFAFTLSSDLCQMEVKLKGGIGQGASRDYFFMLNYTWLYVLTKISEGKVDQRKTCFEELSLWGIIAYIKDQ